MIYFISDLHFGHKNCLAFDNRQFPDIETHDEEIVRRWNSVVWPDDDVWILGDISFHGVDKTAEIFNRLNGIKHLCIGNHDKFLLKSKKIRDLFVEIVDYKEIDALKLVLCHYPIPCYNKHFYGWVHLYGHVHNSFEWNIMKQVQYQMEALYDRKSRAYNVGCMLPGMGYTPRTLSEILSMNDDKGE